MKHLNLLIAIIICGFSSSSLFAQESNKILLRTGDLKLNSNILEYIRTTPLTSNADNYKLLAFSSIPTQDIKESLNSNGIQFLEYIPNQAYIVKLPPLTHPIFLQSRNIIGVYDLPTALKLDYRIIDWDIPSHASAGNNLVKVSIIAMKDLNVKDYASVLSQDNIIPYRYGNDKRFAYCEVSKNQIDQLVKLPWVRSIELIDEPGQPESTEGRSIQKSNIINNRLNNGLRYDASGVHLLVRDDGLVGPHIDFEGRLFNLTTDATGTHGDGVAGVMGGAGNIDPSVEAGASGADISVINYQANFQDNTLSLHQNSNVMITNSSYSNGCNAGYTSTTETVDKQVFDNQTLMHVFSAGNSNSNDCNYGAGDQWGNITGGHKMGKNVITVANLYNDGSLVPSSSRGPAHDGRIKPDMAAHGQGQMSTDPNHQYDPFGGTSAAAPSLAGNLGQLYEAYKDLNNNANPNSALIKAAAMNSATDLGNKGPDYRYGYGMINTGRAYEIIANNQYLSDTVSQSDSNTHTIIVPANTGQLRIMLYWHDPEAAVNTNKALVNDLDMIVNGTLLPLVLNDAPNATTLNDPAVPGADHLNNIEQVVVDYPSAGSYTINVKGFQVPSGPQEYFLVYTFIKDEIKVTYPLGGESLIPGQAEIVHWDAYGDSGSFTIEYSTDNGANWNNIGSAPGDERNISWTVPAVNTADALVRVSRLSQSDVSDETIHIFPVPNFTIQNNNATSIEINWPTIAAASKYYIWQLGNKYMEIIDSTTTNQYVLGGLVGGESLWLSVSASSATITGQRAIAENFIFNPYGSCNGCLTSIYTFPYYESFENGLGLFCQSNADDIDYTINSGGTFTNNTGPTNASDGSQYIYLEASNPNNPLKDGILGSPCYNLTNAQTSQLKFDYHMYGSGMGRLDVQVSTDGGQTWSSSVWSKLGDQGNQWFTDSIDFSAYQTNQVSFRFVGRTGTSARSDIAIDNLVFDAQYPLSVGSIQNAIQYTVQPNPSDGIFHLNTIENLKAIKVLNSFGQVIQNINPSISNSRTVNLNENAAGIYFLILQDTKNQVQRLKIVRQ